MSAASIKEKLAERLRSDGSYEQISGIWKFISAPFSGGKAAGKAVRIVIPALLICGLFTGMFICRMVEGALMDVSLKADLETAERANSRAVSFANASGAGDMGDFADVNLFGADIPPNAKKNKASARESTALGSLTLHGTLPDAGAWIAGPSGTKLYLKGQDVDGYKLESVKYGEVVLVDAKHKKHSLYLILSGGASGNLASAMPPVPMQPAPRKAARRREQKQSSPALDFSGIEPASADQEGSVPRELVDALLMNPYDELSKMRMEPAEDGSGMQLKRIAKDSVFAKVGVAKGDIIQAVNGVTISNMADAANAVNSLMAGTRFDVTVQRDGEPLELKYQVK